MGLSDNSTMVWCICIEIVPVREFEGGSLASKVSVWRTSTFSG